MESILTLHLSAASDRQLIRFGEELAVAIEHCSGGDGLSDLILEAARAVRAEKDRRLLKQ